MSYKAETQDLLNAAQKTLINQSMTATYGAPTSSSSIEAPTGIWCRYDYADAYPTFEISGSVTFYTRISNEKMQFMMFIGDLSGIDANTIMNNNLK